MLHSPHAAPTAVSEVLLLSWWFTDAMPEQRVWWNVLRSLDALMTAMPYAPLQYPSVSISIVAVITDSHDPKKKPHRKGLSRDSVFLDTVCCAW